MPRRPSTAPPVTDKIRQWPSDTISRTQITAAPYNPRKISERARALLKANLKEKGLMGGVVWNKTTGNLVAGHQKLDVLDAVYKVKDYPLTVTVVELSEVEEKEQNLFMNNTAAQGVYDRDRFFSLLESGLGKGMSLENTGFSLFDIETQFGTCPAFLRDPSVNLGFLGGQKLADGVSGLGKTTPTTTPNDAPAQAPAPIQERLDTPAPTPASDKNSPEALKARKQEYAGKQDSVEGMLEQDADYAALLVFRSREDKEKFLRHNALTVGNGKYVNADELEVLLVDKARWR